MFQRSEMEEGSKDWNFPQEETVLAPVAEDSWLSSAVASPHPSLSPATKEPSEIVPCPQNHYLSTLCSSTDYEPALQMQRDCSHQAAHGHIEMRYRHSNLNLA